MDKVRFVGKVGLVDMGCMIPLTLNLLFTGTWLSSSSQPSWVPGSFIAKSFCQGKRCWYVFAVGVGHQACPLVLNMFSFFLLGMESCTPGVAGYDLGCLVSPECMDASHNLDFYLQIHSFLWQ